MSKDRHQADSIRNLAVCLRDIAGFQAYHGKSLSCAKPHLVRRIINPESPKVLYYRKVQQEFGSFGNMTGLEAIFAKIAEHNGGSSAHRTISGTRPKRELPQIHGAYSGCRLITGDAFLLGIKYSQEKKVRDSVKSFA